VTAQVANTGIVGSTSRIAPSRQAVASSSEFIDPMTGAFAPATHDQASRFDDTDDNFETPRRRRRYNPYQDQVVSFGGVLVSREVGATIMKEQAAQAARGGFNFGNDAERSIAIYEFNQSLMGVAEAVTDTGVSAS
jgi:hypothetical protein